MPWNVLAYARLATFRHDDAQLLVGLSPRRRASTYRRLVVLAALAVVSLPAGAHAAKKRVGVTKFEGQRGALIRHEVVKALERHGYDPVSANEVAAAAANSGAELESEHGFMAVAKALGVVALVTGDVGAKTARLAVRGADGAVKGNALFAAANPHKLAAEVSRNFWERLGPALDRAKVLPGAKRTPTSVASASAGDAATRAVASDGANDAQTKPGDSTDGATGGRDDSEDHDREAAAADRPRSRRRARVQPGSDADLAATAEPADAEPGSRWLELALGARGFSRNLSIHQHLTGMIRQHQMALGPAVVLDVALYPLALVSRGPAANIGLVAEIEQAVGSSSQLAPDDSFPNGAAFRTWMRELAGGLRYRVPLGDSQIGASVTGGEHAFWFIGADGADRNQLAIPNTIYRFVRGGVDARVALTQDFYVAAGAGYRHILNSAGPVQDYFPHLTVAGVDAEVGVAYRITNTVEARLQGNIRRYFYDMHSIAGDTWIAGGAVDQYLSVAARVAVTVE